MYFPCIILGFTLLFEVVNGQRFVGDVCNTESGSSGTCKLFSNCQEAQEELKKFNRFPKTCGFEGTQPVVCCPNPNPNPNPTPTPTPTPNPNPNPNPRPGRNPGEVAKRKCREYSAYAKERRAPPTLIINATQIVKDECGHKAINLIVGGELAGRKEFPHMAAIGYEPTPGEVQYLCGGTIVSNRYVLTAAHCLSDISQGNATRVKLGVTNLRDSRHIQEILVEDRIPYPQYRSSSHYHDLGLLKLATPAKLNPYARPACLYLKPEVTTQRAIATGWGHTSWGGTGSENLLKVTINLFEHSYCNQSYKNQIGRKLRNGILNDLQLCAGSETEEKDTCQGDSGGPLQIYHVGDQIKCMYDVVGITSFGKACSGSPGVYVRVSHYVQWIEDIVWPQT